MTSVYATPQPKRLPCTLHHLARSPLSTSSTESAAKFKACEHVVPLESIALLPSAPLAHSASRAPDLASTSPLLKSPAVLKLAVFTASAHYESDQEDSPHSSPTFSDFTEAPELSSPTSFSSGSVLASPATSCWSSPGFTSKRAAAGLALEDLNIIDDESDSVTPLGSHFPEEAYAMPPAIFQHQKRPATYQINVVYAPRDCRYGLLPPFSQMTAPLNHICSTPAQMGVQKTAIYVAAQYGHSGRVALFVDDGTRFSMLSDQILKEAYIALQHSLIAVLYS